MWSEAVCRYKVVQMLFNSNTKTCRYMGYMNNK